MLLSDRRMEIEHATVPSIGVLPRWNGGRDRPDSLGHFLEEDRSRRAAVGCRCIAGFAATGAAAKVSIDNFVFNPKELVVTAGARVTWVNSDDVAHTVTSTAAPPLFDSKTLHADGMYSFEFKTPGTYDYFCKAHPSMTGKIIVK
jgi:plastocyanin